MHIRVYEIPIPKRNESTVESFQTVCNLANASMRLTRYRDFERFPATRSPSSETRSDKRESRALKLAREGGRRSRSLTREEGVTTTTPRHTLFPYHSAGFAFNRLLYFFSLGS